MEKGKTSKKEKLGGKELKREKGDKKGKAGMWENGKEWEERN